MTVTLCVLLTAAPGQEPRLVEYEDQVLELLGAHGARLLQRVRTVDPHDTPHEVHVIEFPSEAALQQYMDDPARLTLTDLRDRAIATTEVLRVDVVT
ncbi:MAG: DUF1330 domain-containing protein [Acidimicrobiia bacterium]